MKNEIKKLSDVNAKIKNSFDKRKKQKYEIE